MNFVVNGNSWTWKFVNFLILKTSLVITPPAKVIKHIAHKNRYDSPLTIIMKQKWHVKNALLYIFFSFVKILHSFLFQLCKYLRGPAKDRSLIISPFYVNIYSYNITHLELKAVPQRPFHDKVPRKHVANWQRNTSSGSLIPTKLLPKSHIPTKKILKRNTSKGLLPMHLQQIHRKY